MSIYDISRPISNHLAVWPGDSPFSYELVTSKSGTSPINLTTLTLSAHTGSHADAPFHYAHEGKHPAQLPLEPYIGSAHVVTISRQRGGIVPADFDHANLEGMERLLIHTWVSKLDHDQWPEDFPYPTTELIDWLAKQSVVLLGVDMPSVDAFDSKTLDCHHRLLHHGMVNLETLFLRDVPDGVYELIALPLKLEAVCGSPVRAILRSKTERD